MTRTLQELRDLIDATDKELLALLNRRAGFAAEVGEIKKLDGSPVYRPEREAQVIHGLQQANLGPIQACRNGRCRRRASSGGRRR